ncbi:hypothetical protein ACK8HX_15425 [Oryzobacter sp. R7]|uniref:hypothetical protein n=1 Tax=Oryzobacter faecalis TaxID=3388656 RepID=UPI00398D5EED
MTGRHASSRVRRGIGPGSSAGLRGLTLLRHGWPSGRATALLLAALSLVTTVFLVALPQLAAGAQDRGIADAVTSAPANERDLGLRLTPRAVSGFAVPGESRGEDAEPPFAAVDTAVRAAMDPRVADLVGEANVAAQTDPFVLAREDGSGLDVSVVEAVVRVDDVVTDGVRWVSGKAPAAPTTRRTLATTTGQRHTVDVVPVALAARTAEAWGVEVGDVLDLTPSDDALRRVTPTAVVLSGTYEPLDPGDPVWTAEPRMLGIAKIVFGDGETKDQAALVAPVASYAALADGIWRVQRGEDGAASPALDHTWRYRLDADRLVRTDAAPLRALLVRLATDRTLWDALPQGPEVQQPLAAPARPTVVSGLGRLLERYDRDVAVTGVLVSFVTGGVTALAVLVLGLTALVGADRRAAEVALLRARGASAALVVTLVAAWTAALGVPVATLAAMATALALPGPVPRPALLEVALVALLPGLAAVVVTWRRLRSLEEVPDDTRALGRAARRVVLELVLVVLALSAVSTVRSRGEVIAAGRTDWFATVTPVLVALVAAVVAIRVLPWPVGLLARLAARGRGLVGYLGLTRAARTGSSAAVPITALVVGTTLVTLTATLSATVGAHRDLAAYRAVGADARVDAERIDPADVAGLAGRDGVTAALPAALEPAGAVVDDRESALTLLAVDPVAYEEVLRGTPAEVELPALPTSGGPLPIVLSGGPEAVELRLVVRGTPLEARRVATVPGLARSVSGREAVVALVPYDALVAALPTTQPNTVLLRADAEAQAGLAATASRDRRELGGLVTAVQTVDGRRAAASEGALARFVAASYAGGTVLAAVLTLLALLLLLATTRPARTQLVLRLRTLGLPHGGERRLAWTEVMPLLTLGVLAGVAAGVVAPVAVAAALDLSPFTGAVARLPVEPRPVAGALAGLAVLVLGALALLSDAVSARHGDLAQHLRRGDSA